MLVGPQGEAGSLGSHSSFPTQSGPRVLLPQLLVQAKGDLGSANAERISGAVEGFR